MGVKVSAAQAARLVRRHERVVRGWIEQGKLVATRAGARMYEIDIADLEQVAVRGVVVDRVALEEMKTRHAATLQPFAERIEAQMQSLERRLKLLEMERRAVTSLLDAGVSSRYDASSETTRPTVLTMTMPRPDMSDDLPAEGSIIAGVSIVYYQGALSKGTASKIAAAHGANPNKDWKWRNGEQSNLRNLLATVQGNMQQWPDPQGRYIWRECDDNQCPCHEL